MPFEYKAPWDLVGALLCGSSTQLFFHLSPELRAGASSQQWSHTQQLVWAHGVVHKSHHACRAHEPADTHAGKRYFGGSARGLSQRPWACVNPQKSDRSQGNNLLPPHFTQRLGTVFDPLGNDISGNVRIATLNQKPSRSPFICLT